MTTLRAKMKCPHCLVSFHEEFKEENVGIDRDGGWRILFCHCPACKRLVIVLSHFKVVEYMGQPPKWDHTPLQNYLVRPRGPQRPSPPASVPDLFANDYKEACVVLSDSPKASAALSRRCLQHLLREVVKVNHSTLFKEIQEVIDSGKLPSQIAEAIDAVRNIGNFAAHPIKSTSSGEIVEVEPGEAEWTLDVLESLFDFYFVQPELLKAKRDALNKKLSDAGAKPMK